MEGQTENPYDYKTQLQNISKMENPTIEELMIYLQSQEPVILVAAINKIPLTPINPDYKDGITSLYLHTDIGVRCAVLSILPSIMDFVTAVEMVKHILLVDKSTDVILTALYSLQRLLENNQLTVEIFLEFVEIIVGFINHKEWRIRACIQLLVVDIVSFMGSEIIAGIVKRESNEFINIIIKIFKRGLEDSCLEVRKQTVDSIADLVEIYNNLKEKVIDENQKVRRLGDDFGEIFIFPLIYMYSTHPNYKIRQSIISAMVEIGVTMTNETLKAVFLPMILNYAFDLTANVRLTLVDQLYNLVLFKQPENLDEDTIESRILPCIQFLLKDSDSDVVEYATRFINAYNGD